MQASDLWKERVGKELEVIHHGPFEKKRLPWEHTSDRDQHNWLAANSAAELWTLRRNEAAAEAAAAGTTRNHPPPAPQQHGIPMPRSTGLSSQQARARPMEVMMTSGGRPDRSELVNPTKNGLYGPGGTAELLNPPVPPKRLYPPSRLDDAAYPTEAKELAERAAAFRFSQPRGPGGFIVRRAPQRPPRFVPRRPARPVPKLTSLASDRGSSSTPAAPSSASRRSLTSTTRSARGGRTCCAASVGAE